MPVCFSVSSHFCKAKAHGTLKESTVQRTETGSLIEERVILTSSTTTLEWTAPVRVQSIIYCSRYWPSEEQFQFYALLKNNHNPEVIWVLTLQSQQNTALGTKTRPEALYTCQWCLLGHAEGTVIQGHKHREGGYGDVFLRAAVTTTIATGGTHGNCPPPQMNNHKRKDVSPHLFIHSHPSGASQGRYQRRICSLIPWTACLPKVRRKCIRQQNQL